MQGEIIRIEHQPEIDPAEDLWNLLFTTKMELDARVLNPLVEDCFSEWRVLFGEPNTPTTKFKTFLRVLMATKVPCARWAARCGVDVADWVHYQVVYAKMMELSGVSPSALAVLSVEVDPAAPSVIRVWFEGTRRTDIFVYESAQPSHSPQLVQELQRRLREPWFAAIFDPHFCRQL